VDERDEAEAAIRKKARSRAALLTGSGFGLLGHSWTAGLGYSTYPLMIAAIAALSLRPGPTTLWMTIGALVLPLLFTVVERMAVGKIAYRPASRPISDQRHLVWTVATVGLTVLAALSCLIPNFGSLVMAGSGMSPLLEPGDRLIYRKHVEPEKLVSGRVISFGVSDRSSWGTPGEVVIARILAGPGDRLSTRGNHYVVNGEEKSEVSPTGKYRVDVMVPPEPETLVIPHDSYFLVQDQPSDALDSQTFSYARRADVISTLHWLVSPRVLFRVIQ
jgi:signal peptidase I